MSDIMMSQIGFWSAFTIIFMIVAMTWFFKKMISLSKQERKELEYEDD